MRQDESSVERRAAVIRKGAERERRDLFADRGLDLGGVKETVLPPPSVVPASVGARNENSVLFRVDQLGGGARGGASASSRTPAFAAPTDDEGVIDLKALASTPPPANRPIVAPLFSEPPPMTLELESGRHTKKARPKSPLNAILVGVSAFAFVVLAGYGISVVFKGEEPVKHAAAAPPAPPPPPPVATPVAAPTPPPAETAAAAEETKAKPKAGKRGVRGKGAVSTKSAAAPVKSGPKPGDSCNCHGEFNCILACTAKGGK